VGEYTAHEIVREAAAADVIVHQDKGSDYYYNGAHLGLGVFNLDPRPAPLTPQRFFQLEKSLSKPGHVYGKFGTGNLETLWEQPKADGRDPREQLIKWWEHYYCARRMKLAVAGREDLDTLEKMVREKFSAVPVRTQGKPETGPDGVRITFEDSPYDQNMRGVS